MTNSEDRALPASQDRATQASPEAPAGLHHSVSVPSAGFQSNVDAWMDACFGDAIKADVQERCDRFIEEALEFVQAAGYSAERAHALVNYTFGRPTGEINQEVGGVMVTLAAMCNTLGVVICAAAEAELARVWTKIDKIRAKQAAKPTGSALPIASAIEARRAATAKTGAVEDESAVDEVETPNPSTGDHP
jgi:NTP pyrophosphatase (non-canonical NTP hydrolase)